VATSPAFPGRPIGRTDGSDRANPKIFTKKPFYYWKINPQSLRSAPRRPRRGEEGAPNLAATELEEGAATALVGRRGRQIRLAPSSPHRAGVR